MLKELSARLTEEFGKGFSRHQPSNTCGSSIRSGRNACRRFSRSLLENWSSAEIRQTAFWQIRHRRDFADSVCNWPIDSESLRKSPFTLSWSHYVLLLTIKDPDERSFYEIEATNEGWSLPELKRQKASCLYERLALSRDKKGIETARRKRPDHHQPGRPAQGAARPRIPRPRREGRATPSPTSNPPSSPSSRSSCSNSARASSSRPGRSASPSTATTTSSTSSSTTACSAATSSST